MAEQESRLLSEAEMVAAFAPFAVPEGSALSRVLTTAREFAKVEKASRYRKGALPKGVDFLIVIDSLALFKGVVADGLRVHQPGSSSAWLVGWLEAEGIDPEGMLGAREHRPDEDPMTVTGQLRLPQSLTKAIFPAARDLARSTTGSEALHLRHVQFELLCNIPLARLRPTFSADRLHRLKLDFAARNAGVDAERAEAWRERARALGPPPPAESVQTHADAPALVDSLGRRAFAEVLGARIKEVGIGLRESGDNRDSAFILHMDGPWGSGKSSILNFLKADLERAAPPWLVVEFNAWRNQSRQPPWWPLINHVGDAVRALPWYRAPKARLVWAWWTIRMRWLPILLTGLLLGAFIYFAWGAVAGTEAGSRGLPKALEDAVNGLLALVALGGLAWTASRTLSFGSSNAAEAYVQSNTEPFRRVVNFYDRLVRAIGRPLAIFIDDLDRCDSGYVIDLIEGVQTLLRSAPVVYVVAGDRKWICSSFEKRYADFCGEIGTPGRPLGYLFLDKVFQLSTSVPQLSTERQAQYWRLLLDRRDASSAADEQRERNALETESAREMKGKTRHEDLQREIEKAPEGSLKRETLRAAAAKQITSPEAIAAAEHRLEPLAGLLEANPRSMKRLVNAYGLNHARAFLEGRDVSVEALARWTIIELRWPLLAEHLVRNWREIADGSISPATFPAPIRELFANPEVGEVIGREGEIGQLTVEALRPILD